MYICIHTYVSVVEVGMGEDRNREWIGTGCSAVEQTAVTAASEPQCGDTARGRAHTMDADGLIGLCCALRTGRRMIG